MAWFRKEKKPRQPRRDRLEIPADVWEKCEACGHTDIREKFERNFNVCPSCDYHRRIRAHEYCALLLDDGTMEELEVDLRSGDPLGFPEYPQRLKKALANAGDADALLACYGTLDGLPVNLCVMDFAFMGGSMGSVVGEKFSRACDSAAEAGMPLVSVTSSGGARMQEGILALMQLPKTVAAVEDLRDSGQALLCVMAHPTTGGVLASFATLGDVVLAEPNVLMSFAGPRVVQEITREKLPEDFGRAEQNLRYGQIDAIVPRAELRPTLSRLLRLFNAPD
jgi:acetyl-CoA carboxylase carboxyl transferase subunit beta